MLQWTIGASLLDVPLLKLGGGSGNGSPIHARLTKRELTLTLALSPKP